jgi:hypothetical protein
VLKNVVTNTLNCLGNVPPPVGKEKAARREIGWPPRSKITNVSARTVRNLLEKHRAELRRLDTKRDKRGELEDVRINQIGMEVIERIDYDRSILEGQIELAKVLLGEWDALPNVDEALDCYSHLLDVVQGRIREAPESPQRRTRDCSGGPVVRAEGWATAGRTLNSRQMTSARSSS